MRNPHRIDGTLAAIAEVWKRNPDMRLGQLLWALADGDPFFTEDDAFLDGARYKILMKSGLPVA